MPSILRTLTISILLAVLVGVTLTSQADAQVFRPRPSLESQRLGLKEFCKQTGGTQFESVYHYNTDGSVKSITTTCHGGRYDGSTDTIQ